MALILIITFSDFKFTNCTIVKSVANDDYHVRPFANVCDNFPDQSPSDARTFSTQMTKVPDVSPIELSLREKLLLNVAFVDVSWNQFVEINPIGFNVMPKLEHLDLAFNQTGILIEYVK